MAQLALGLILLALLVLGARWFAGAPPNAVAKGLRWGGFAVLALAAVMLAVTGRLGWALAGLAGLIPWAVRAFYAHSLWRNVSAGWKARAGGAGARPGNTSQVVTAYLRMTLDHDSGAMAGRVVHGTYSGRGLDGMTDAELSALWREVQPDPDSAQVLEVWLDRNRDGWRDWTGPEADRPPTAEMPIDRAEALRILGLEEGATPEAIHSAHRRLMKVVHPDLGGSAYLAARINQARDLLIKT